MLEMDLEEKNTSRAGETRLALEKDALVLEREALEHDKEMTALWVRF